MDATKLKSILTTILMISATVFTLVGISAFAWIVSKHDMDVESQTSIDGAMAEDVLEITSLTIIERLDRLEMVEEIHIPSKEPEGWLVYDESKTIAPTFVQWDSDNVRLILHDAHLWEWSFDPEKNRYEFTFVGE